MAETIFNKKLFDAEAMDGDLTSDWMDLSKVNNYSITLDWTGSPEGEIKLQAANDTSLPHDIAESVIAISGADKALFSEAVPSYDKVRVVYTRTSGTGNLTAQINGKGNED